MILEKFSIYIFNVYEWIESKGNVTKCNSDCKKSTAFSNCIETLLWKNYIDSLLHKDHTPKLGSTLGQADEAWLVVQPLVAVCLMRLHQVG